MDNYVLTYYTIGSPARPKGERGPNQEHKFEAESDDKARQHVRDFCKGTPREPDNLYKVVSLR